ncbi:MAG: hypothetical protein PHU44_09250 [Syntrophales bacterium]|nr:hypothetical protein [Syntrophales bacterium]MDD5641366.1 hypothetical protein [Syntrophales bacterium]
MSDHPRIFLGFRSRSYSEQEQQLLKTAVGGDFEIELRPYEMPEAGGTAELWAFLQAPEGWIVSAVLSGLAYDVLKGIGRRLSEWFRQYGMRNAIGLSPEVVSFTVDFDGIHYELVDGRHDESPDVYFVTDVHLEHLPEILQRVVNVLSPDILRERGVKAVKVPVFASIQSQERDPWFFARYWTMTDASGAELLFDELNRVCGPTPKDSVKLVTLSSGC